MVHKACKRFGEHRNHNSRSRQYTHIIVHLFFEKKNQNVKFQKNTLRNGRAKRKGTSPQKGLRNMGTRN